MFDAAVTDRNECEPTCYYRHRESHIHCAIDRCYLWGEGGGGDYGEKLAGYTDSVTCAGEGCDYQMHYKCALYLGKSPFCKECFEDATLLAKRLGDVNEDTLDAAKLTKGADRASLMAALPQVDDLYANVDALRRSIADQIVRSYSAPLPGLVA